jgi:hypothetical protein
MFRAKERGETTKRSVYGTKEAYPYPKLTVGSRLSAYSSAEQFSAVGGSRTMTIPPHHAHCIIVVAI